MSQQESAITPKTATIKVLPARLANQIAAGEVVERPASVLKELLENSIDAGATQVDIEIEKGGHKKIKITDNGSGIAREQLMLALSRHATSKVSELDDLENINTLGFRGEALASISSVSRLTLISRTAQQTEAWQARTEGRDMQVQVEPAAHPQGTSVEVLDLFFNTPARRKFLRTEKTEFNHIEELFNRIALSRHDVGLRLKHNGKLLKNLPAILDGNPLRRVKQLCGGSICDGLLQVEGQYQGFRLRGWISGPGYHRAMSDIQYVFVNNRMMRDKLIFHAVRQAYEGLLPRDKFPYFVLYLEVPCSEVDVNVHPAKHEVRFHQSRLVHDFIFSVLNDAMNNAFEQANQPKFDDGNESTTHYQISDESVASGQADTELKPDIQHNYGAGGRGNGVPPNTDYITPLQPVKPSGHANGNYRLEPSQQIKEAASQYTRLMTVPVATESMTKSEPYAARELINTSGKSNLASTPGTDSETNQDNELPDSALSDALLIKGRGLLAHARRDYYFLSFNELLAEKLRSSLSQVSQPLLLPVSLKAASTDVDEVLLDIAMKWGIELQWTGKKLILKKVPAGTREQNWQSILHELVGSRFSLKTTDPESVLLKSLALQWAFRSESSAELMAEEQVAIDFWQTMSSAEQQALLLSTGVNVPLTNWLAELCP